MRQCLVIHAVLLKVVICVKRITKECCRRLTEVYVNITLPRSEFMIEQRIFYYQGHQQKKVNQQKVTYLPTHPNDAARPFGGTRVRNRARDNG